MPNKRKHRVSHFQKFLISLIQSTQDIILCFLSSGVPDRAAQDQLGHKVNCGQAEEGADHLSS